MASAYEPVGYCPRCGYRMDSGECPECGRRVQRPARRDPRRRRWLIRWSFRLAIVAAIGWLGVMGVYRWVPTWCLRDISEAGNVFSPAANAIIAWRELASLQRAERAIATIVAQIREQPEHAWAGAYAFTGSYPSTRVHLGSDYRFASLRVGCSCNGDIRIGRSGVIHEVTDSTIVVRSDDYAVDSFKPLEVFVTYHRVRWGERVFLLNSAVPLGSAEEPQTFEHLCTWLLMRVGDSVGPLDDWPEFPPEILASLPEFPATVRVLNVQETFEDRDDLDLATGDADFSETVYRTVRIELVGEGCLPEAAYVTGLYANLPKLMAFRDRDRLVIDWEPPDGFPLPDVGWRFAIDSANYYVEALEDESSAEEDADVDEATEVVAQGQRPGD